jgi:RNA polymerase sigma-70 factor (ECF subfamily)
LNFQLELLPSHIGWVSYVYNIDGTQTMNVTGNDAQRLAERFEAERAHLRAVAYRMLGSLEEAEDAVQEAWLRLSRTESNSLENLRGWLMVVVARVCLDMLRARKARREAPSDADISERFVSQDAGADPESEASLADSVGLALLVVLDTLPPAERLAFVLHDMFAVPFDEIAPIVGRSPTAARQLASRARRRVQGTDMARETDFTRQRKVVEAFLAASRSGNFEALLAVLDPDVVVRADRAAVPPGAALEFRGAETVAKQAFTMSRRARFAQLALVNGTVGVVVAPLGRLLLVMAFKVRGQKIVGIDVIADPERLRQLNLAVLDH